MIPPRIHRKLIPHVLSTLTSCDVYFVRFVTRPWPEEAPEPRAAMPVMMLERVIESAADASAAGAYTPTLLSSI
jgi:hypothetical protein